MKNSIIFHASTPRLTSSVSLSMSVRLSRLGKTRKSKEELFVGWEGLVRERKPLDVTWREHRRLNRRSEKEDISEVNQCSPSESLKESFFFVAQSSIGAKSFYSSISSYRLWWLINISINLSFILLISTCHQFTLALSPPVGIIRVQLNMFFVSNLMNDDLFRVFHFGHSRRFQLGYSNFLFISNQLESWLNYDVRRPSKKAIIFAPSQSAEIKLDVKEIHSWFCVEMCLNH